MKPERLASLRRRVPAKALGIVLGAFFLPFLLFGAVTLGSRTLLPVDNLYTFEPYATAAPGFGLTHPHNALLSDLILENYAWKRFVLQSIGSTELPLWNPYIFAGAPFLANGQHSALYPLSLVYYVFPLWRAYGLFALVQLGLAGLFMFVMARVLGVGRLGAVVAGMTFQLSGFFVVSVVHPMMIAAAAWLPLILAMIELIVRQRPLWGRPATVPWVLVGALALGCQTLAGHIEPMYYSLLVAALYTAWRLLYQFLVYKFASRGQLVNGRLVNWWQPLIRPAVWICVMVGLGMALGAIQLVPFYQVASHSFREGSASLSQVRDWAYPWRRLVTFGIPNFFGNPAHHEYLDLFSGQVVESPRPIDWGIKNYVEGGAYLGLLPLFLAGLAILAPLTQLPIYQYAANLGTGKLGIGRWGKFLRHPYTPFFTLLSLLSLSFIFGTPLYALVYALPGISQLHSPFRWVFPLTLSVAVLAGLGVDVLQRSRREVEELDDEGRRGEPSPLLRRPAFVIRLFFLDSTPSFITALAGLAFWGGLLTVGGLVASRLLFNSLEPGIERVFGGLAKADTVFPDARAFYSYEFRWVLLFGLLLTGTGIVLRVSRCPIYVSRRLGRRPVWELLAVGLLGIDLLSFGAGFHAAADPDLLDYEPPALEFLREDPSLWRLTTFDPNGRKTFDVNAPWFYDLQDVRGYDSIFSAQYRDYMRLIDVQDELEFNRIAPLRHTDALHSPMLDLLNVKYVLTEEIIDSPKYELVFEDKTLRVYENLGVVPRAFTLPAGCQLVADDPLDALRQHDPRQMVVLESGSGVPLAAAQAPLADCQLSSAAIPSYTPNQVFIDVQLDAPGWLVLADSYAPGWKAFVRSRGTDGSAETEMDIFRVDGNFRGVSLGVGRWTVRFKYSPDSVKIGAFVSFLSGVICLFLAAAWGWRFLYRVEDDASTVKRVAKNSLAPIAMNLMNRTVDMAFAALMARVLGPEGSGKYAYAVVVFGWFDILCNFGLNTLLMREVARDKSQANRYWVNTTILRLLLAGLAAPLLALFLFGRQALLEPNLAGDTIWAIALLFVGLLPASISVGLTALFQAYERHEIPAAITSVTTIFKVVLGTLVLWADWGIVGLAGASILTNLATLAILTGLAWHMFGLCFKPRQEQDWGLQRSMTRESFPLMLNHLMATLFFRVDIVLLEALKNSTVVGWYSWAYKGLDALNIIPSFFTFAIFPVMARQAQEDREALSLTYHLAIKLLVIVALPAALLMTMSARLFIAVLGGSAFLPDSAIALQLMVWSIPIGWINSVTNYVLIAVDQQRFLTRAFVVGLTFNLVANLVFIPQYSYRAAALITILSELVLLGSFYVGIRRYLAPVPWLTLLWRPALAGAAMVSVGLGLWRFNGVLALVAALGIYAASVLVLGVLDQRERAIVLGRSG